MEMWRDRFWRVERVDDVNPDYKLIQKSTGGRCYTNQYRHYLEQLIYLYKNDVGQDIDSQQVSVFPTWSLFFSDFSLLDILVSFFTLSHFLIFRFSSTFFTTIISIF